MPIAIGFYYDDSLCEDAIEDGLSANRGLLKNGCQVIGREQVGMKRPRVTCQTYDLHLGCCENYATKNVATVGSRKGDSLRGRAVAADKPS